MCGCWRGYALGCSPRSPSPPAAHKQKKKKKHKTTKDERLGLGIGVWDWGLGSGEWQKLWFARVNCKILLTCSRLLFGPKLAIKNGL